MSCDNCKPHLWVFPIYLGCIHDPHHLWVLADLDIRKGDA